MLKPTQTRFAAPEVFGGGQKVRDQLDWRLPGIQRPSGGHSASSVALVAPLRSASPPSDRNRQKKALAVAAICAGLFGLLIVVALKSDWGATVGTAVSGLREAGPVVFFLAMALLPALGFPLLAFTLAAGPVFGPTLGAGWVILWSLSALVVNLLLAYWLANRALRPLVSRLLTHFDYRLPESAEDGAWQMALIVRLIPGPPYWAGSYLLALLRVPLAPYLIVSTAIMAGYIVALVCGGEAILQGSGRMAFAALGGLAFSIAALQLFRQRLARRRAAVFARG